MLTEFAKEHLRKVATAIREDPRRIDMGDWLRPTEFLATNQIPECGTVGCIAGWTVALLMNKPSDVYRLCSIDGTATRILGLNPDQAALLFHVRGWPKRYRLLLDGSRIRGTPEYGRVVYDRIHHFIDTDGD